MEVNAVKKNFAYYDKIWKAKEAKCKLSEFCSRFNAEEGMNCVNNCTSLACYNEIYSKEPLEDGEIDYERSRRFTSCLREECKKKKGNI